MSKETFKSRVYTDRPPYEPLVVKAAWTIFGDSYRYRKAYDEYRRARLAEDKKQR
jgi:hypothetical protein